MKTMQHLALAAALVAVIVGASQAATPPDRINYQGVLRDSDDRPYNGEFGMIFRFFSDELAGDEILLDDHIATPVTVTGGLFNVALGSGEVFDGLGPGTYTSLAEVFRDYDAVWLEVEIEGESLTPRLRVISAAYALNADHLDGKQASEFIDTSGTAQTKSGKLLVNAPSSPDYGIEAHGPTAGGFFNDSDGSGYAYVGYADFGVQGYGTLAGGYFFDPDQGPGVDGSSEAYLAYSGQGVTGFGSSAGGFFRGSGSGFAYVGFGDRGIEGHGTAWGGYFEGANGTGVEGRGGSAGGYFSDFSASAWATVGWDGYGIDARGETTGGFFRDSDSSGNALVGYGDYGIQAFGDYTGGYFKDQDGTGEAWLGFIDDGLQATGNRYGLYVTGHQGGGFFQDRDNSSAWAVVGQHYLGTDYKIRGGGTVSFVQNHPEARERVVVYAAPEGDEVAVYTRGTARLLDGEARVALGETFQWVANPDIGLTAHLTPHGECSGLYIDSLTPRELLVREVGDGTSDVTFDYIVYGLRIGYEQMANVQVKQDYSPVPAPDGTEALYAEHPELRRFSALERFKAMRSDLGITEPVDQTRSREMVAAINRFHAEVDGKLQRPAHPPTDPPLAGEGPEASVTESFEHSSASAPSSTATTSDTAGPALPADEDGDVYGRSFRPSATDLASLVPVSEEVEPGDVLVADSVYPGRVRLGDEAADPAVVGIVSGEPGVLLGSGRGAVDQGEHEPSGEIDRLGQEWEDSGITEPARVPVAFSGIVSCKVDAGHGAIQVGDLLTTSPTPGHAMKTDVPLPGTVLGKALEPLETGTGAIKVLVMLR